MSEDFANQPGYQLAKALEAIQREEKVFAGLKADHKASMEALYQEANRLQQDILTGQKQLPLEPIADEFQQRTDAAKTFIAEICEIPESEVEIHITEEDACESSL